MCHKSKLAAVLHLPDLIGAMSLGLRLRLSSGSVAFTSFSWVFTATSRRTMDVRL
jgi:hypothetical protein